MVKVLEKAIGKGGRGAFAVTRQARGIALHLKGPRWSVGPLANESGFIEGLVGENAAISVGIHDSPRLSVYTLQCLLRLSLRLRAQGRRLRLSGASPWVRRQIKLLGVPALELGISPKAR